MARDEPDQASRSANAAPRRTLIVDPGAYSIKAGFAPEPDDAWIENSAGPANACRVIPNCIARSRDKHVYIGSELELCNDFGEMVFRRPVEKGYVVNWDAERTIWEREFFEKDAKTFCDPHETSLLLTEPPNAVKAIQSNSDQIIFEGFEFAAAYRAIGSTLNAWCPIAQLFDDHFASTGRPAEFLLVIDSSHSHTTITPTINGQALQSAIRRSSIGGKHLTNSLAELISLRHFGLIEEPYICEQIKRDACFVSLDFNTDLEATWSNKAARQSSSQRRSEILVDYVLPDYEKLHRGYIRKHDASHAAKLARLGVASAVNNSDQSPEAQSDTFPLANERFTVPELLFTPSDIGLREQGIPELVMSSLSVLPRPLWQGLLANILLVGGNSLLEGYVARVEAGIRSLTPAECVVRVKRAKDPIKSTWMGGAKLAATHDGEILHRAMVTREEYLEHGEGWVLRQMAARKLT